MADTDSPSLDNIKWEVAKTSDGTVFEIGSRPTQEGWSSRPVSVRWEVTTHWTNTTDEVRAATAITKYWLADTKDEQDYRYVLRFFNGSGDDSAGINEYHFKDEGGRVYVVPNQMSGVHIIRYNSQNPTIVSVAAV